MSKIYNALRNNFTQISNFALLDIKLSAKAYKLYAYMCYRIGISESWEFNEPEILKHFKEKRDAMRVAKSELIETGYLVKIQTRKGSGIFSKNDYQLMAEPENKGSTPPPENPSTVNPSAVNPSTENTAYSNKERNNKDLFSLEETKKYFSENDLKSDPEDFWNFWDRKGWKDGKSKIENRETAVKGWERNFNKMYPKTNITTLNSTNSASTPTKEPKELTDLRSKAKMKACQIDISAPQHLNFDSLSKTDDGYEITARSTMAAGYAEILNDLNINLKFK